MANDHAKGVLLGQEGSYALIEVIGRGAYGTVYKGIWREVGRHVAVKRISRSKLSTDEEKALQDEIQLLKNLNHHHIVNYIEAVDDPHSKFLDIVMEFVEGGSLESMVSLIRKSQEVGERVLTETIVADLIAQVLKGLQYLHQQGVIHRDIKGANLLVTKERQVKLADFGVSSTKPADNSTPLDVAGSPYWMAPEVITLSGASTVSDVWSLGCTVIELLTGLPPYHQYSDVSALFHIVADNCPPFPPNLSTECEDFLRSCFIKDVERRPGAAELLLHKWVSAYEAESPNVVTPSVQPASPPTGTAQPAVGGNPASPTLALDKYEEDEDEDFDDLEFGEEDASAGPGSRPTLPDEFSVSDVFSNRQPERYLPDLPISETVMDAERSGAGSPFSTSGIERSMQRLSARDDPFGDVMDDPEADQERELLRKQKERWEVVKLHVSALGTTEEAQVAACEALIEMFKRNPEQRYYLMYDPGLLPIIEVLESGGNGSTKVVEAMLRVLLAFLEDEGSDTDVNGMPYSAPGAPFLGTPQVSSIREALCFAGVLPVVMRYCQKGESFEARLFSARFLEKMLEFERALQMFVACRGFSVYVDMLEPDVVCGSELARTALIGIDRLLSMENQKYKRDFCRRFAWSGLLDRIVDGISFCMDHVQSSSTDAREGPCDFDRTLEHVIQLALVLQTFAARADPMVKAKMTSQSVLHAMIRQITNQLAPPRAVLSILCCVRDLSRDPLTHTALQGAGAIETLVQYLSVESKWESNPEHDIISSLHNLCIVSPLRQEAAAQAGLVPHLQRFIRSKEMNVRSLCIDMYSGLACAGPATRLELGKHKGVEFYVDLLVQLCGPGAVRKWQARVLQSLTEWLDDETQSQLVEARLISEENQRRIGECLLQMRVGEVEVVLEPYLKMISVSDQVNLVFGDSEELMLAMVRWLGGMYGDNDGGGEPRGRLLLLRTLLAHARMWGNGTGNRGVMGALQVLLQEVILNVEEAITVREQAAALVATLDNLTCLSMNVIPSPRGVRTA